MFKLLSKESNIFSIPIYIGVLLGLISLFNLANKSLFTDGVRVFAYAGLALGYFCINSVRLNYQTHVPLFIYTILSIGFITTEIDLGIAVALFINSLLVLMLSSPEEMNASKHYVLVGSLLTINFIFLPPTFPMIVFVTLHIFATSKKIGLCLFRLIFGMLSMAVVYFSIAYFLQWHSWDLRYLPIPSSPFTKENLPLIYLTPIGLLLLWAIVDHFLHYNEKSPVSRYKYTFLLTFLLAQSITIILYMETTKEYLLLIVMPMSIIFARFLRFRKRYWESELGILLILLTIFIYTMNK